MLKILVLDDEPKQLAKYLCHGECGSYRLEALGAEVTFVTTPHAAEAALKEKFDVLFLDGFLMFGQQGGQTLHGPDILADWQSRGFALPPVYMISTDAAMCARGIALGAKGMLSKDVFLPFCSEEELTSARAALAAINLRRNPTT